MKRALLVAALLLVPAAAWAQAGGNPGGVVGGSGLAQWLWNAFGGPVMQTATKGVVGNVLKIVAPTLGPITALVTFQVAKRALFGSISMDEITSRAIRVLIVTALATPAVFNAQISQKVLVDIPAMIVSTGTGEQSQTVMKAWDAEINAVGNFASKIRLQAAGPFYFMERGVVWLGEIICYLFIILNLLAFILTSAASALMLPLLALTLPFWCFDATADFAKGAAARLIGLFMTMAMLVWLGAYITHEVAAYMGEFGQMVQSTPAASGFRLNAGDALFTSLGITDGAGGTVVMDTTQAAPAATFNISVAIETLFRLAMVCAFGAFLQVVMFNIANSITGHSGFSLRGPVNVATSAGQAVARRMRR